MASRIKFYTRKQVAEMLVVSTRTIDRWLDAGKLKRVKLGDRRGSIVRITHASLEKLIGHLP
ncbi:MAG: DNA-binding protein [Verrucomicrobiales bacterium]|nr:DNA-binding protein [Verrucomicrobiales bacterium]